MRAARRLAAAILLLGAAACSGGGGSSSDTSTTDDATTVEPEAGGVLRMGIARLASLDPADVSPDSPSSSITADLLFDGLTRMSTRCT